MTKRSRRRRSAWASITEIDKGERYRIRYWAETPEGYRRVSETVRGTRIQAEKRRAELMLEHGEDAPCPTVGQVWERWALPAYERRVAEGDMAENSLKQFRGSWRKHAGPRWADVPCDQVKPLHVQQWLDGMAYSAASAAMVVLRPTLDYAVRYGQIQTNPFRERYLMPSKRTVARRDDGTWTLDELGQVWRSVHGQWYEAAFLLSAFGGLRVGEALGVMGVDVSVAEAHGQALAMVEVRRQMPNRGAEPVEKLKTAQSRRVVAIPGRAGARLLELALGNPGYLSGDGLGRASTQTRLNRAWGQAHPFRNLRNSWETNMRWTLRLPPWLVEPMMGHAVQGTTGQYYDRPQGEMFAEAVADAYAAHQYDAAWSWADRPNWDAS